MTHGIHERQGTALISPAMGVPARVYRRLSEALASGASAQSGFEVGVVARRGVECGSPRPARAVDWSYEDEADDLAEAIAAARARTGGPVLVIGHSLGAQLAALAAQRSDHRPDGIVAIGASVPWFRHYGRRAVPFAALAASVRPVTAVVGHWPRQGFAGPTPRTLMRQWARMVLTGRPPFDLDGSIRVRALMVRLGDDELVTDQAAAAYEAAFSRDVVTRWTYDESCCPAGGDATHLGWSRAPEVVARRIAEWWTSGPGAVVTGEMREDAPESG
ncbi:hypothetical protein ACN94_14115 [Gordonia paraffinivorans]|uniref:alpha/beta fold hydrolase n=1 Tax=Gordonia paraffinivorans TaxID=175628 RepID=UPI0021B425FC|nr:alpha/beta fold hydrolase [Gordonia paraffinivorans]MBY4574716.1 hypothetical protein [Gordonia paraffinivorans]